MGMTFLPGIQFGNWAGRHCPAQLGRLPVPAAAIAIVMVAVPAPGRAVTMAMTAIVMIVDSEMNAGSEAADMGSNADVGTCRRRAEQAQCKHRSDQFLHGSLPSARLVVLCFGNELNDLM
jgi:hypothetical protein